MHALKRIIAYGIDYVLVMIPTASLSAIVIDWDLYNTFIGQHFDQFMWVTFIPPAVLLACSAVVLGTLTGLVGWTPGKLLLSLRVRTYRKQPIGILRGIGRELIKVVSFMFFLGMLYALYTLVENRRTFYDEWLDCDVPDLSPWGMTKTQKNWRKVMNS